MLTKISHNLILLPCLPPKDLKSESDVDFDVAWVGFTGNQEQMGINLKKNIWATCSMQDRSNGTRNE